MALIGESKKARVLIIDDNDDLRESLKELVELWGHEVFEASDGREGIRQALAHSPDVAFVDISLPILDGFQVAQALREHPDTCPSRLVALTGYAAPEDRRRALASGFDHHLAKPVDQLELERLLSFR